MVGILQNATLQIMMKMKIIWKKMRVLHQIMYFNVHNGSKTVDSCYHATFKFYR